MKIIKIAQQNIDLPPDRAINRNTVYTHTYRLTKIVPRQNIDKEYIVRVYRYEDGMYSVVGWNGRRGRTLRPQPKYFGSNHSLANATANILIRNKQTAGYEDDNTIRYNESIAYMGLPDYLVDAQTTQTRSTSTSTSPAPAVSPAPSTSPQPSTIIPSIRLQPEYIPNANTEIIEARRTIKDGTKEFIITVYDYKDGYYSTIEWYAPRPGVDHRIHPKLITRDRAAAISMAQRLVDEKISNDWTEVLFVPNSLRRLNRGHMAEKNIIPESDRQPPSIEHFINEMRGTGTSTMGKYRYSISRGWSLSLKTWVYDIFEKEGDLLIRSVILPETSTSREVAILQAAEWAKERRDELLSPPQEKEPIKEPPKPPSPPREITEQEKKWMELMNSSMAWYKTAYSAPSEDWYMNLGENIGKELKGYFKFIVKNGTDIMGIYNIWWEGLDSDLHITKHDMPTDEFEKYKSTIISKAKIESLKAYKEVMLSYGEM